MTPEQLAQLFEKYLSDTATPRERKMVEAWLLVSEQEPDAVFVDGEQGEIKARLWAQVKPAAGAIGSAAGRVGVGSGAAGSAVVRRLGGRWLQRAAVWLALAGIGIGGYVVRYKLQDILIPAAQRSLQAGLYETRRVVLPDSSVVLLA